MTKKTQACMHGLVEGYNKMMEDPKAYAESTYKSQIKSQGKPNPRDARNKAEKSWNKNDKPI